MRAVAVGCALVLAFQFPSPRISQADTGWKDAKAHTAWVTTGSIDAAKAAVVAARNSLVAVLATAAAAKAALALVEAGSVATATQYAIAFKAYEVSLIAVAAARAVLYLALIALAAAIAAALGFAIGTAAHEGGYALSHWCWDPVCPAVSNAEVAPAYSGLSLADLDRLIPQLVSSEAGFEVTKEDFMGSPAGIAAWNFTGEAARLFVNAHRGAVASTEGRHEDVLRAVNDMNESLTQIPKLHVEAAEQLETMVLVPPNTLSAFEKVSADLGNAIVGMQEAEAVFGEGAEGRELLKTYQSATAAMIELKKATDSAAAALSNLHGDGGEAGLFPQLSRAAAKDFAEDCAARGQACLPEMEVDVTRALLLEAGGTFLDWDFYDHMAQLDASPAASEAVLFGDASSVTLATILRFSGTKLSESGKWLNIDLEQSPLTKESRKAVERRGGGPTPRGGSVTCSSSVSSLEGPSASLLGLLSFMFYMRRRRIGAYRKH
jgi:hypothetical protein